MNHSFTDIFRRAMIPAVMPCVMPLASYAYKLNGAFKCVVSRALMMALALCVPAMSYAYELRIQDSQIEIPGLGWTSKDGMFFFKEGVAMPNSISIDEFSLDYKHYSDNNRRYERDIFIIINTDKDSVIFDDDRIFYGMNRHEMSRKAKEKGSPLYLSTDANYRIEYGDRSWPIKFVEMATGSRPAEEDDPETCVQGMAEDPLSTDTKQATMSDWEPQYETESQSDIPVWMWILLSISVLSIIVILVFFLYKKRGGKKKAAEPAADGNAEAASYCKDANQQVYISKPDNKVEQPPVGNPDGHILSMLSPIFNMFPDAPKQGTVQDRLAWLQMSIASLRQEKANALRDNERLQAAEYVIGFIREKFDLPETLTARVMVAELSSRIDAPRQPEDINRAKKICAEQRELIEKLEYESENYRAEIDKLREENSALMSESAAMAEDLHSGANEILGACRTLLDPCEDKDEVKCIDIENRLFRRLDSVIQKMRSFRVGEESIPADTRKAIRKMLAAEAADEAGAVNTVCRYYAYSRIPSMADAARKDGIIFNRKNMTDLYLAIENLYVKFGIDLGVASLLVKALEEGNTEKLIW